ncbi:MAG: hypothetical protein E7601_04300 [Ruminococcaceae bacterium]|nr:hypothetical protein [Oscillospiraceae bacterium]
MNSGRSHKGVLYSVLGTLMSVAFICLVSGIVFLILGAVKNYSVWIFGAGSQEILPAFIGVSFLLIAVPMLTILIIEKKNLRKIWIPLLCACVCVTAVTVALVMITSPNNHYTVEVSDNGRYTVIICEANKGEENEVIFYQLLGDNLMRRMSTSKCICEGYRPISEGNAEIEWSERSFTVKIPYGDNDFKRQTFSCIED